MKNEVLRTNLWLQYVSIIVYFICLFIYLFIL